MSLREIKLRVPTGNDLAQENLKGLILHEINQTRANWQDDINTVEDEIKQSTTNTESIPQVIQDKLASAETALIALIDAEISGKFVTESKNYVDDKILEFERHVTEQLATKANKTTVDALDEFFKVVDSAMQFTEPGSDTTVVGYSPPN